MSEKRDVIYRIQYSYDKGATWLNVGQPYTVKEAAVLDAENGRHYARTVAASTTVGSSP